MPSKGDTTEAAPNFARGGGQSVSGKVATSYSRLHPEAVYGYEDRLRKARTILAVLTDALQRDLRPLRLLDIGASTGIIADFLAEHFAEVIGVDVDMEAIRYARSRFRRENLAFYVGDATQLPAANESIDVIVCAHVYEHVSDARRLLREMQRVLSTDGVCYFAAGNRLRVMEPHYRLPFLSVVPRPLGHWYVRAMGRSERYEEQHLTYWGLRKLVEDFEVLDYTRKTVERPSKFAVDYMLPAGSAKQRGAKWLVDFAWWLVPSYIWVLKKRYARDRDAVGRAGLGTSVVGN